MLSVKACLFILVSLLAAFTRINERRTEFAFLYCSSVRGPSAFLEVHFTSEFTLHKADRIFPVLPLLVCKSFTLTMSPKLEEFLAFVWKEIFRYLKFRIMLKPFFHLYLMFLFRQLDNDDAPTMKMTGKDR